MASFSIKYLFRQEFESGTQYSAEGWDSFQIAGDGRFKFLYSPKAQSPESTALVEANLKIASGEAKTIKHEEMMWLVAEEFPIHTIRKPDSKLNTNLSKLFFLKHILGDAKDVYVPVYVPTNDVNYAALECAYRDMEFDPMVFIRQFSAMMVISGLIKYFVPEEKLTLQSYTKPSNFFGSTAGFWGLKKQDLAEEKKNTTSFSLPFLRSKL